MRFSVKKLATVVGLAVAVCLLSAAPALALDCVAQAGGIIDGFVNYPNPPAQINIDGECTIRNYPASNPLTSNISWFGSLPSSTLLIFDNVVHTGNMSCNLNAQGNKIWFVNSSSTSVQQHCLSLLIPVEKIDKQNVPTNRTTATIGVPFTWKLVIPVLFDPGTGTVIDTQGSVNDLHSITVWDDLTATGVDLSVVSETATWLDDGTPVPHTFTNNNGFLTFDGIPIVNAGRQFAVNLTVVLNDDPAVNTPGKQFVNTATWQFGRLIDGVFYQPLPGENGISPPLTIAAPVLTVDKSGPATMNLGQWGTFTLDTANTGLSDAWDVTLRDLLPNGATGGMCDLTPEIQSAQVFAADGVTPVAGKGPLAAGVDYTLSWSPAPACRLDLKMLTAAGSIAAGQRLIVHYRTQLDANTQNGVALTNIAGAIQWFNGDSSNASRVAYNRTLTDGTPAIVDFQDAFTVNTALTGFFFEKTAADRTTGVDPTTTAAPGDTLRYTLRFRTTDQPLNNFRIFDDMGAMNPGPAYVPGTLTLVTVPPGANTGSTSANGGTNGTGVLDVRSLSLPANSSLTIQFDIRLAPALTNGTVVTNQASSRLPNNTVVALSDDPNVNGTADPLVAGDEDPTRVTIQASPAFRVQKISTDMTGDPNVLLAGETLRYTITVQNIGNAAATGAVIRDAIPANTAYVAGSTRLNGAVVADVGGTSALVSGMLIHPPSDPTPGSMPVGTTATIVFDVVIDPAVLDGTIISNQGFVSATPGIVDAPSDDPRTPIPDDPTRNVVGNHPLLYATKTAALAVDLGTPGVVDPGDVLRYTITIQNSAAIPSTGVVLIDAVPANTTYVANTTTLNGAAVGQPDGGVAPLASGIAVGTIPAHGSAVVQYELRVVPGTPAGTLIVNQATVHSVELPDLLTDGDGDPANGAQPTVVVVGAVQELSITKQVSVVGGGPAIPGAQLDYVVTVTNFAAVPALTVVITDALPAGQLAYVPGSATMNGSATGVTVAGTTITADFGTAYGPLAPGATVTLRFRATLDPSLALGTVVTNTADVTWNTPTQTASASVSIAVGGVPGVAVLNGSAWRDADFDQIQDTGERPLIGWAVDLYRDNQILHTSLTDANGAYRFVNVEPNDVSGSPYEIRFRAPGAVATTATLGRASSPFTNGPQRITGVTVSAGANLQGLNLPITPNGVVYNAMARIPIGGATLTLLQGGGGAPLPAGCFDDPAQQGQVTLGSGYYKFDLNFSDPACPSGSDYVIAVAAPPGSSYVNGPSQIIPPATDAATAAFSVPACPAGAGDAIPSTTLYCEAEPSQDAPTPAVQARTPGTIYYLHLVLDGTGSPGTSQIFDNHIPLDPQLAGAVAITKTTPLIDVTRGQLVPYTITVDNVSGALLTDISVVDDFPAGFTYVPRSALVDGTPAEPAAAGRELRWTGLALAGTQSRTIKLLLAVGPGVSEGEYVNRARVVDGLTGAAISGEATATVRVAPDPNFDCTDVLGKVWNDANRNGVQDEGEGGIAGVRLVTVRGLQATTDAYGRYHITCAIVPNEDRGSNFILKLDERTLPSGFRMSTPGQRVERATRGKALGIDFGASIFRVVAIDLSDAAFEPGSTDIRVPWRPRIDLLVGELHKAPAVLRLTYLADTEDAALVGKRVEDVKRQITAKWDPAVYPLTIEQEIFWRKGAPSRQPHVETPKGR
ncbi:MAG TPA: SdrD B-like domain-containing protein [Candidatus Polarisedimenticolaceae bacterium]|nr:SdrD B-like domain-containing protein [Candidatus Polarisedimenticolaceae bacterium]